MIFGVIQAGIWMNAYNSLRSAANDTGRYVMVQYQRDQRISNIDIATWARNRALTGPYNISDNGLTTYVSDAPNQSINFVTEKTLKIVYDVPSIIPFAAVPPFQIAYTRSIFVKTAL